MEIDKSLKKQKSDLSRSLFFFVQTTDLLLAYPRQTFTIFSHKYLLQPSHYFTVRRFYLLLCFHELTSFQIDYV